MTGDAQLRLPLAPAGEPAGETLAGADAALDHADEWWRSGVDQAITVLAEQGRPFTVEDVRALVGEHQGSANAWGPPFQAAHRRGLIRPLYAAPSARTSRHHGLVRTWVGAGGRG